MVTEDLVMLVIRASRPNFRNDYDKLAFVVHSAFFASGYVLTATGHAAFADNYFSYSSSIDEVGIDHWNEVENKYAFVYRNPNKGNTKVLVKCLVIGDNLMVDAMNACLSEPVYLGISVDDYVTETAASDYRSQYKNLGKLLSNLQIYVLSKLDGLLSTDSVTAPSSSQGTQVMQPGYISERDPTGRFAKYSLIKARHGTSSKKDVYPGVDEVTGVEVYWCTIPGDEIDQKKNEPKMLQSLEHQNIIKCYSYWPDNSDNGLKSVHMITEAFSSENLRVYSLIHDLVGNIETIKKWCQQILSALEYLHSQNPPVIHRDLNLQNIFINGTTGKVKLVEFGLAVRLEEDANLQEFADAAVEYMAPEVFTFKYDQLADIYSFGMCVLQMMSKKKIYSEYRNRAEIETKIKEGVRPAALDAVTDYETREFIQSCLVPQHERPTASNLLGCSFIATGEVASIPTGESSRAAAEADQRRRGMDVSSRRKHVWRQRLSKLSSVSARTEDPKLNLIF